MAEAPPPLPLDTRFAAQAGLLTEIVPGLARLTAPNTGPLTFTGTNTYLVGRGRVVVVDPGPNDHRHLAALQTALAGRPVSAIVLTHTHRDHAGLARALKRTTGAPIRFLHRHRLYRRAHLSEWPMLLHACDFRLEPDEAIADGGTIEADGLRLEAIATPGHCENHLAFAVTGTPWLLSGDHVMGWSSTVIAPPDGAMGPYLASLERLITLPCEHYLPGHGGPITDGPGFARALLGHRRARNAQIIDGIAQGAQTREQLLHRLYPTLAAALKPAARLTIAAHLDYLTETDRIVPLPRQGAARRYRLASGGASS